MENSPKSIFDQRITISVVSPLDTKIDDLQNRTSSPALMNPKQIGPDVKRGFDHSRSEVVELKHQMLEVRPAQSA